MEWLRPGISVEVADTHQKKWYNGELLNLMFCENESSTKPAKKELSKIKVLVHLDIDWSQKISIPAREIAQRVKPSNLLFPQWVHVGCKVLYFNSQKCIWLQCQVKHYSDGCFLTLKPMNDKSDQTVFKLNIASSSSSSLQSPSSSSSLNNKNGNNILEALDSKVQKFDASISKYKEVLNECRDKFLGSNECNMNFYIDSIQLFLPPERWLHIFPGGTHTYTWREAKSQLENVSQYTQIGYVVSPSKTLYLRSLHFPLLQEENKKKKKKNKNNNKEARFTVNIRRITNKTKRAVSLEQWTRVYHSKDTLYPNCRVVNEKAEYEHWSKIYRLKSNVINDQDKFANIGFSTDETESALQLNQDEVYFIGFDFETIQNRLRFASTLSHQLRFATHDNSFAVEGYFQFLLPLFLSGLTASSKIQKLSSATGSQFCLCSSGKISFAPTFFMCVQTVDTRNNESLQIQRYLIIITVTNFFPLSMQKKKKKIFEENIIDKAVNCY
ncbi:hypothetical protein RFI_08301 [Reticulomyxa filosa]|uniref:Uncharacterized protein n=1 Tax=Reticulomyxa filosa TaxID=46433 RepID=X6NR93_RETFI|nr:hypothetical protein RFI_08301 [Reticulomyxa filosa]|eukprot:ETO28825.1 hypothetical protein RFI_08301 [Reticulomyxa filosa]